MAKSQKNKKSNSSSHSNSRSTSRSSPRSNSNSGNKRTKKQKKNPKRKLQNYKRRVQKGGDDEFKDFQNICKELREFVLHFVTFKIEPRMTTKENGPGEFQEIINLINVFTGNSNYDENIKGNLEKINQLFKKYESIYNTHISHPNINNIMLNMYILLTEKIILKYFSEIKNLHKLDNLLNKIDPNEPDGFLTILLKQTSEGQKAFSENTSGNDFGRQDYNKFITNTLFQTKKNKL